jgi:hypothetical protein
MFAVYDLQIPEPEFAVGNGVPNNWLYSAQMMPPLQSVHCLVVRKQLAARHRSSRHELADGVPLGTRDGSIRKVRDHLGIEDELRSPSVTGKA